MTANVPEELCLTVYRQGQGNPDGRDIRTVACRFN